MEVFKIFGTVSLKSEEAVAKLDEITAKGKTMASELGSKLDGLGTKFKDLGKSMTLKVTAPIAAGFAAATKIASDYEENLNKLDVAFGKNSQKVKDFANNAMDAYGLSKNAASEAAAGFGALGKGIGLTEDQAADTSITLTQLSADLASYFNTSNEDAAKALEGIFTGESEALKRFGVVMTDTNLKAFAEDAGLVWEEMDQNEKTMLRYNYVLAKTKDAQGDYSRTSDGTANSLKTFKAATEDLSVAVGSQLLPMLTPVVQKVTDFVQWLTNLPASVQNAIVFIGLLAAAVGPLLIVIGSVVSAVGTIFSAVHKVMNAVKLLWGVMSANPIMLIIGVIALLVGAFIALWNNNEDFRNFWINLWNKLKTTVSNAITAIKNFFERLKEAAQSVADKIASVKESISEKINAAKTAVSNAVSNIKSYFSSLKTAAQGVIDKFKAVYDGIKSKIDAAKTAVKNAIDKIKSFFPISIGRIFSGLSLPHFSVSPGSFPWGIGGRGSMPSFSVSWYKKAMENPYLFTKPTIFGINPMTGSAMGAGEAGEEVMIGKEKMLSMMQEAVARENAYAMNRVTSVMESVLKILQAYMPELTQRQLVLDTGAVVGGLAPAMDTALGQIYDRRKRGV